jgi:hypothetical protein
MREALGGHILAVLREKVAVLSRNIANGHKLENTPKEEPSLKEITHFLDRPNSAEVS